ncbi:DUF1648 domain-containing protein [Kocuria sp.]|uniref:DUF1648 domain-containing protein n=1 Tax=Kocuria sp. TaxID=1871328 RepID=UPI0026E0C866|nr:DUF1648 domain-containing protein [Kocuria sp.]MDO5619421.1 DUF1648 domain-containing protein [Kocuria sp.]
MTHSPTTHPTEMPSAADRPSTSDGLPTGVWLRQLQEDGYRPYTWSNRAGLIPVGIGVVVVLATLAVAWLVWDRLPEQVPLHTGADGQVTRWGEKTVGNVLMGPLMGGGGMLLAMVVVLGVAGLLRPRPSTAPGTGADSLGTMVRQAATMTAMMQAAGWGCLGFLLAITALEVPRWIWGYDTASPVWLFGVGILVLVGLQWVFGRRVRSRIEGELAALEVPVGPQTERELEAWRYVTVVDDPSGPLWVPLGVPSTNFTVNIAKPLGKVLALGFVGLLLALALGLLLMPLLLGS